MLFIEMQQKSRLLPRLIGTQGAHVAGLVHFGWFETQMVALDVLAQNVACNGAVGAVVVMAVEGSHFLVSVHVSLKCERKKNTTCLFYFCSISPRLKITLDPQHLRITQYRPDIRSGKFIVLYCIILCCIIRKSMKMLSVTNTYR